MPARTPLPDSASARWMVLVASIWIQSFSANPYSLYSPTLKTVLGITQFQLNILAVAKDVGEHVGILPGILSNKWPPWTLLTIGSLLAFVGYGLIWLTANDSLESFLYILMLVALCIGSNSATWFNTAVLVTCMRNFSHSRGTIAGFLKGFVGLSSAICTQIFVSFLSSDPLKLLLFLAIGPPAVSSISMSFVRPIKAEDRRDEEEDQSNFFFINILCIVLAIYLFVVTVLEAFVSFPTPLIPSVIAGVMLLFLAVPTFVPLRLFIEHVVVRHGRSRAAAEDLKEPLIHSDRSKGKRSRRKKAAFPRSRLPDIDEEDEEAFFLALAEGAVGRKKGPRRGEDFKLKQALVKADFWLLFLAFFCGVGPGIVTFDNLAQLGEAHGSSNVTSFLALLSIFNFLGRLGGGFVSEHYVRLYALPRPVWMALAQAVMIVANVLFAFGQRSFLGPASAVMGLCFGVQFSVMIPTASELFGLKHFGLIYNFINLSIPLGSLCFSALLAGLVYDWEGGLQDMRANLQANNGILGIKDEVLRSVGTVCHGMRCFRLTYLILAGVCVVGILLSIFLSYRINPVYKTLYPNRPSYSSLPQANLSSSDLPPAVGLEEEPSISR